MPRAEAQPTTITNLQKVGDLRFHAKPHDGNALGEVVIIEPGQTGQVPAKIWDRYKDRDWVKQNDRILFVIGGLKPGEEMRTPNAQEVALRAEARRLEEERVRLEAKAAELEAREMRIAEQLE